MSRAPAAITGNLTAAPQVRSHNGRTRARARVATNDRYQRGDEWVDAPAVFHNIEAWGRAGDVLATATQGTGVVVLGAWRASEYEHEGEPRRFQYIDAEAVGLIPPVEGAAPSKSGETEAQEKAESKPVESEDGDPFAAAK